MLGYVRSIAPWLSGASRNDTDSIARIRGTSWDLIPRGSQLKNTKPYATVATQLFSPWKAEGKGGAAVQHSETRVSSSTIHIFFYLHRVLVNILS